MSVSVRVIYGKPPNYDSIVATFGPLPPTVVFAYCSVVYAPGANGRKLPDDLLVHELTHLRQQAETVGRHHAWWERYLADPEFRLLQEVEAYQAQIAWWPSRPLRREAKRRAVRDLTTLYGLRLPADEARRLLSGASA